MTTTRRRKLRSPRRCALASPTAFLCAPITRAATQCAPDRGTALAQLWQLLLGPLPYLGALIVIGVQSVQQPVVTSALRILVCDRSLWCHFGGCYDDPSAIFIVSVLLAIAIVLVASVGVPTYLLWCLVCRKEEMATYFKRKTIVVDAHDGQEEERQIIGIRENGMGCKDPMNEALTRWLMQLLVRL